MAKIIGNPTVTPMAIPDWNQDNPLKADFIKNKPYIGHVYDINTQLQQYTNPGVYSFVSDLGDTSLLGTANKVYLLIVNDREEMEGMSFKTTVSQYILDCESNSIILKRIGETDSRYNPDIDDYEILWNWGNFTEFSGSGGNIIVDQTYSPDSKNAQSGKAVAEALADIQISGGSVQSDWDEENSTSMAYIKNKPTKISQFVDDTNSEPISLAHRALQASIADEAGFSQSARVDIVGNVIHEFYASKEETQSKIGIWESGKEYKVGDMVLSYYNDEQNACEYSVVFTCIKDHTAPDVTFINQDEEYSSKWREYDLKAVFAMDAINAYSADNALNDHQGNVISDTYATKEELGIVNLGELSDLSILDNYTTPGIYTYTRLAEQENGSVVSTVKVSEIMFVDYYNTESSIAFLNKGEVTQQKRLMLFSYEQEDTIAIKPEYNMDYLIGSVMYIRFKRKEENWCDWVELTTPTIQYLADYVKKDSYEESTGVGLYVNDDGLLQINAATEDEINEKVDTNRPITPAYLEYAVEVCTNQDSEAELTEAQLRLPPSTQYLKDVTGDIETALDTIIAIQNELIGGASE